MASLQLPYRAATEFAKGNGLYLCLQGERRPEEFGLPDMVQQYHSLFPLEDLQVAAEQASAGFGVCSMLIRAVAPHMQGQAVTLRRLDPRQASLLLPACYTCFAPSL